MVLLGDLLGCLKTLQVLPGCCSEIVSKSCEHCSLSRVVSTFGKGWSWSTWANQLLSGLIHRGNETCLLQCATKQPNPREYELRQQLARCICWSRKWFVQTSQMASFHCNLQFSSGLVHRDDDTCLLQRATKQPNPREKLTRCIWSRKWFVQKSRFDCNLLLCVIDVNVGPKVYVND